MLRKPFTFSLIAGLLALTLLTGCSGGTKPEPPRPSSGQPSAQAASPAPGGHAGETHDGEQVDAAGLAETSSADRAAAEKQGVCPVTGEKLGSMGDPYKTTVKGQTVFLCCEGCEEKLKKDPDTYLAKLGSNEK